VKRAREQLEKYFLGGTTPTDEQVLIVHDKLKKKCPGCKVKHKLTGDAHIKLFLETGRCLADDTLQQQAVDSRLAELRRTSGEREMLLVKSANKMYDLNV
jgi:hypothetical protein